MLVGASFVKVSWIAGQGVLLRWVLGAALVALPIGIAGLIFPMVFQGVKDVRAGFASNLLGAVLGGCAEYTTMLYGIQSLTLAAALIYAVVLVLQMFRGR